MTAAMRLWHWLTAPEPQGYWFSRPLWVHFCAGACLVGFVIYVVAVVA